MTDIDTRYVAYTVYREQDNIEKLGLSRLHAERTLSRREAHDLAASYLMSLMAGTATVRASTHRDDVWWARFGDAPSRDEIVVIVEHVDEVDLDAVSLWAETTATWHLG